VRGLVPVRPGKDMMLPMHVFSEHSVGCNKICDLRERAL
jgi:hypothetical protein